jgi:hypothetical protein
MPMAAGPRRPAPAREGSRHEETSRGDGRGRVARAASSAFPYALALLAHASIVGGASLLPAVSWRADAPSSDVDASEIEIDVAEPRVTPNPAPTDETEPASARPREAAAQSERDDAEPRRAEPRGAAAHRANEGASEEAAPRAPGGDGAETAATSGPAIAGDRGPGAPSSSSETGPDEYGGRAAEPSPGWGGFSVLGSFAMAPSKAAPTTTDVAPLVDPESANHALARTLRSRDKKVGVNVPAARIVVGTVSTTMRAMPLPHNAHATFEVTLAPGGKVTGARVVSSSAGDAAAWDAAAKSVASSLANRRLELGPDASKTGVTVRVSVTQKHVYPAGSAKGIEMKPVCANGFINDLADAADDKPAKPVDPKVPLFQDENGRPCIPVGVSATADAANIGAEKHIEVRSTFEVIVPGQVDLPDTIAPVNLDAPWIERGKQGPRPTLPQKVRKYMRDKEKKK